MTERSERPSTHAPPGEPLVDHGSDGELLPVPMSVQATWVRSRLGWWTGTALMAGFPAAVIGIILSPGFWWSEGPFYGPNCWEPGSQYGDEAAFVALLAALPLSIGAVRAGMYGRRRRERRADDSRPIAFPAPWAISSWLVVVPASGLQAKAVFDARLHRVVDPADAGCLEELWPATGVAVFIPLVAIALFVMGWRALDYG